MLCGLQLRPGVLQLAAHVPRGRRTQEPVRQTTVLASTERLLLLPRVVLPFLRYVAPYVTHELLGRIRT